MKIPRLQAKAKALDLKKDKIMYAGLALLAGLMAVMALSTTTQAKTRNHWNALSAQKFSH